MTKRLSCTVTAQNTGTDRRSSNSCRYVSPMYPSNDALYSDVKKILLSAWKAKAASEGKSIEQVVGDEVRRAIERGADARLGRQVKKAMLDH